ncbi:MAG: alginate lyase family protein [Acidobacteriaceae bacterium]|nr:alginate lyase family protein [Acidobacteriaceae bacterium]
MDRRHFCFALGSTAWLCSVGASASPRHATVDVASLDRKWVLAAANKYLLEEPRTVTAASSPRSTGGPHDFFSEGDYWWPDPRNPDGPYIRRDGFSNPDNFTGHRELLLRFSVQMPALTSAWLLTKDKRYAEKAAAHLRAWFVSPATRMNPNLQYAQAIRGVTPGRGIGIIDTLHLVEVARATQFLTNSGALSSADIASIHSWFADYLTWMSTSKNGQDERDQKNNHGSCWIAQYAAFSQLIADEQRLAWCRERFRSVLVPDQIAPDGRLPLELARTKPYSYALFDLDVLSTICQLCSTPTDNLWRFETPDGRGIAKAVAFMEPFIRDKSRWPFAKDVEFFDDLPNRQPALLFAGLALQKREYLRLWKTLNPQPTVPEIVRNFPIRQPLLWVNKPSPQSLSSRVK